MKLAATTIFSGPSVFSQTPVARFSLAWIQEPASGSLDEGSVASLCDMLPGFQSHFNACVSGLGEPPWESSRANAPGHLFEHVCIELQRLAGASIECSRGAECGPLPEMQAVVAYEDARIVEAAAELAAELFAALAPTGARGEAEDAPAFDLAPRIEAFLRFARRRTLPVADREVIATARRLDVPVTRLAGRIVQLGQGCRLRRLSATKTSLTNVISNDLAANKDYTRRVLADLGLPVPRFDRVYRQRDAVEAARRIGYPVVVKPNNGNMGGGVSVGVRNRREVREAYRRAREHDRSVLVEEQIEGFDYRLLVIDGALCAASHRVPGHVVGDGIHSIEALVEQVNSDPRRGDGPMQSWTRLEIDEQAERLLEAAGHARSSVPAPDEVVYLRRNANTSAGGTAVDVTDEVHPDNREIAVRAARAIGLDIAGVDLLTRDISKSIWRHGGAICEINSRPGIRKHIWPAQGEPRDVTTPIIEMLYPPGSTARIPTIAVTGVGHRSTTAQMLAHVLASQGARVGLVTRHRAWIGGRKLGSTRLTQPQAARMILLDPAVEVAVLEITPEDVLEDGLGCDALDVSIFVGLPRDDTEDAAIGDDVLAAMRVIARTTRRAIILEGDGDAMSTLTDDAAGAAIWSVATASVPGETPAPPTSLGPRLRYTGGALEIEGTGATSVPISSPRADEGDPEKDRRSIRAASLASAAALALGLEPAGLAAALEQFEPVAGRRRAKRRAKQQDV